MLHVYKASAGSGKTYTLTRFYLKICFDHPKDPAYFRHILTMTFTNAATAEMKMRILEELKLLAFKPEKAEHLEYLMDGTGLSEMEIGRLAEQILRAMMEYYSSFAVTTIDSFFQTVLRLFTRELDIKAGYQVELNTDQVLEKAVGAFLEEMQSDSQGLFWIEAVLEARWEEGKSNSFRNELTGLGKQLFSEGIYEKLHAISPDQLQEIRARIIEQREQYKKDYQAILDAGWAVLEKYELTPESFKYRYSKAHTWLNKYNDLDEIVGEVSEALRKITEAIHNPDKWITKSTKGAERDQMLAALDELYPLLEQSVDFIISELPKYQSFKSLSDNVESFGFLSLLEIYVQRYCEENQRVLISETTALLRKVIDHQMLPFFYERLGERFDHILLDEFQDTSTSQWENLQILVDNAVAQAGGSALIVGDVKQAIYRWRNGDWSILQFKLRQTYEPEGKYEEQSLECNWRSHRKIVEFNNALYGELPHSVAGYFQEEYQFPDKEGHLSPQLAAEIYRDSSQKIDHAVEAKRKGGYVQMDFFLKATKETAAEWGIESEIDKDEQEEEMFAQIKATIADALQRGYRRRDICILVRKSKESKALAEKLMEWQKESGSDSFRFASPEIVRLDQSFSVQLMMAFFRLMQQPKDGVARAEWNQARAYLQNTPNAGLESANLDPELPERLKQAHSQSLWEIAEDLIQEYDLPAQTGEIPFLQEFQDQLLAFAAEEGGHVREWLAFWEENKVYEASVALPEEQDAIRLMTIHKSKGMEFPIVILPFFCSMWPPPARKKSFISLG
jgi:ATP-dependent exoDNAse (exonuclease V) beta subunit